MLLGALAMAALTEWWGWDFVGIVVPGYLCSVLLLQPIVGGVVLLEAVLTYALARGLDWLATRARLSYPVFGRDRFFLILVTSVAVRVVLEGFVLQWVAGRVQGTWPAVAAHRSELFGIGVVLVPLAANRLWRPGLRAGLVQLGVQTGFVWLVITFLLSRFTNFSLGGFELAYDQLALSFVSSPRAQIALLVTAALASGFNRRYGWDFHGILVPALLALAAVTPLKLATTVAEALLIVGLARLLLWLPLFRNANVEGSRKVVLCFLVGFLVKLGVAFVIGARYPGYRASDFFGLGYVLPSLLAERIWLRRNLFLVVVPTVQTAALGAAQAAAIVLALAALAPGPEPAADVVVERYHTLAQAVASLAPIAQRADGPALRAVAARALHGRFDAVSADGYGIAFDVAGGGVVAIPQRIAGGGSAARSFVFCDPAAAELVAAAGSALAAGLVVGPPAHAERAARALGDARRCEPPPPRAAPVTPEPKAARPFALELFGGLPHPLAREPAPARAVTAAAFRVQRDRGDPARLAAAVAALGLRVHAAADGLLVLEGPGWPTLVLRPGAAAVVASPHARELGAPPAALFAAERLHADCLLPGADGDGLVAAFAMALAEVPGRPVLVVRGTGQVPHADGLVLLQPDAPATGAWLAPLLGALEPRLRLVRDRTGGFPQLRAFPSRAGRAAPLVTLWLGPQARRALAGSAAELDRPDVMALAAERQVPVTRGDMARWIAQGAGAPEAELTAVAERLARTRDLALLRAPARGGLALFVDEPRGLSGVAVEAKGRRALAIAGALREGAITVADPGAAATALAAGARLVLAGGAR
ncbi:MAG TPA: poly-gamma-glutamate biosynthesis protein PgsC/CapC [Polyangia bacterium]